MQSRIELNIAAGTLEMYVPADQFGTAIAWVRELIAALSK